MSSLTRIQPNLLLRCPQIRQIYQIWSKSCQLIPRYKWAKFWNNFFSFFLIFFFILHTLYFHHKMQMHTLIELKLDIHKGLIKAHLHTNFGWNPIKIYGVMIDFYIKMSKVCHAYRVNYRKELVETWHVDGVTIVGVPFVVWKESIKNATEI